MTDLSSSVGSCAASPARVVGAIDQRLGIAIEIQGRYSQLVKRFCIDTASAMRQLLEVTVTDRQIPLVPAAYGTASGNDADRTAMTASSSPGG